MSRNNVLVAFIAEIYREPVFLFDVALLILIRVVVRPTTACFCQNFKS